MSKGNKEQQIQKERKQLKDTTHFVIITSIIVPILVAVIGIFGTVVLPRILDQSSNTAKNSQEPVSGNIVANTVNTTGKVVITIGFLPADKIVSYVKSQNFTFSFNNTSRPEDFEMQKIGNDYFVVGFASNPVVAGNVFLASQSSKNYTQQVQINLKDITSIAVSSQKNGKDNTNGLSISASKVQTL